jgi:DNA-binding SARP family transcriptional activator
MDADTPLGDHPLFRVRLWGTLRVEKWRDGRYEAAKTTDWGGSNYPRLLLKGLLCCPERSARREALLEMLWPEVEIEQASANLNTATTKLRALLRPAKGRESLLVTEDDAAHYRLPEQEVLWVDSDAVQHALEQAERLGRTVVGVLPILKEAITLSKRGIFLEGEESLWAAKKRATRDLERYRARIWLSEMYEKQNQYGQAETVLTTLLEDDPFDEDVLCRLMQLLHGQGMTHQALLLYQRMHDFFYQEQMEFTETTKTVAIQLQENRTFSRRECVVGEHEGESSDQTNEAMEGIQVLKIQRPSPDRLSSNQKSKKTVSLMEEEKYLDMDPIRRAITKGLFSLSGGLIVPTEWWERLASPHSSAINTETFVSIQQLLETGWGLSNTGELHVAEQVLVSFLPRMLQLAPHRQEAAALAAEGLRLHGILAAHQQRIADKLTMCLQAVEYARQAKDLTILIAQLVELSIAFIYARQPTNALKVYEEALSYCKAEPISPFVRARIYAAAAPTFAKHGESQKASSLIEKAYESFPMQEKSEPNTFSADNRLFMIDYYQGLLHLVKNQPGEAYKTFEQALTRPSESQMPERWRLIILNYQGLAAISSHQMELYVRCLEDGISGSLALGSKKRLDEAISIYQQHLPKTWYTAPSVKQIAERFQLERESRRANELEI